MSHLTDAMQVLERLHRNIKNHHQLNDSEKKHLIELVDLIMHKIMEDMYIRKENEKNC